MLSKKSTPCPISHTLSIVGGKWKILVLQRLMQYGILRYKELERTIPQITPKMLVRTLKSLEMEGLLVRKERQTPPMGVEYTITTAGQTLMPIIEEMSNWGILHLNALSDNDTQAL